MAFLGIFLGIFAPCRTTIDMEVSTFYSVSGGILQLAVVTFIINTGQITWYNLNSHFFVDFHLITEMEPQAIINKQSS